MRFSLITIGLCVACAAGAAQAQIVKTAPAHGGVRWYAPDQSYHGALLFGDVTLTVTPGGASLSGLIEDSSGRWLVLDLPVQIQARERQSMPPRRYRDYLRDEDGRLVHDDRGFRIPDGYRWMGHDGEWQSTPPEPETWIEYSGSARGIVGTHVGTMYLVVRLTYRPDQDRLSGTGYTVGPNSPATGATLTFFTSAQED